MQIKTLTQPFLAACLACLATLPLTAQNPQTVLMLSLQQVQQPS